MPHHDQNDAHHDEMLATRHAQAKAIIDQWGTLTLLQRWQACRNPEVDAYVIVKLGAIGRNQFEGGQGPYGPGSDSDTSNFPAQPMDPLIATILGLDSGHKKHP